ncbi:MAG: MSCRAMM family protein, partial [Pyrinomonadaceae bacterium]
LTAVFADGTGPLVISDTFDGTNIDWSQTASVATPPGTNVSVGAGAVGVTFPGVATTGATTIIPIEPASAGAMPNGFVAGSVAFDINTTAAFTPPAKVCFTMPASTTQAQFNATSLLHNESGVLVDRTVSRNFGTKQICGQVSSFSPFVLAEQTDPTLPSITGLAQDADGNPLSGVTVFLTGNEDRTTTTDSDGLFTFVNLTDGANYNVQPKLFGFVFDQYSEDVVNTSGERSVVFSGIPGLYQISGHVADQSGTSIDGVSVSISGSATDSVKTGADGNYTFADLPADGTYGVSAADGVHGFAPSELTADPLIGDVAGLDFIILSPTAANAKVAGRVAAANCVGIRGAVVTLTDAHGQIRTVLTTSFGYFSFDGVATGNAYVLNVESRRYRFENMPRVISVQDNISDLEVVGT